MVGARATKEDRAKGTAGPAAEQQAGKTGIPRDDAGQSKSARMTRAEFRKKKDELIQTKPVIGELKVKDLCDAFGQPTRKQTIDRKD